MPRGKQNQKKGKKNKTKQKQNKPLFKAWFQ